jgi:hypothetical protein
MTALNQLCLSAGDAPANVFPARKRDYGSALRTFRIMRSGDRCGTALFPGGLSAVQATFLSAEC